MGEKLGALLRSLRSVTGATLREVEKKTRVSNAYLSQLENNAISKPSPHILYKLAEHYGVPYEYLMEAAGYMMASSASKERKKQIGAIEAALMSAKLDEDEESKVVEFIEFLRSHHRTRRK